MKQRVRWLAAPVVLALATTASCHDQGPDPAGGVVREPGLAFHERLGATGLPFTPLPTSAACIAGGTLDQVVLPAGFTAVPLGVEGPEAPDLWDMNTVNETGPQRGRFLYRTHEIGANGGVSETDLETGITRSVARRADWERFDGIAWSPWGTLLAAEETITSTLKDPELPAAVGGHVYEIDPRTGAATLLKAVGSRSHEGLRFDRRGNLYGISERSPGYIYRFKPAHYGDLSAGDLYALRITEDFGDRTGWAEWVKLDGAQAELDSDAAAAAAGATGYGRPEDVEIGTSTGSDRRGDRFLYVAITSEHRVLAVDLRPDGNDDDYWHEDIARYYSPRRVFVSDYVRAGVNAPADFASPDNLALDRAGNLYISEDPGGTAASGKTAGDDVWAAPFNLASSTQSLPAERFLSITDCDAEPTGIYFSPTGRSLYVNIQHRGGTDPRDFALAIQRFSEIRFSRSDGE
jgi:hypothetical protein